MLMAADKIQKSTKYSALRESAAVVFLVLLIFTLAILSIDGSCYWGDDFAAYISQGIAMSEGRLDEQAALNLVMHPSPLPTEALEGGELTYVWAYPLILSGIYRLVGFDRVNFGTVFFYKLPSVVSLALLAGVLFYFYRRRFGFRLSFLLALLFCCCTEMFDFLNTIYSDLVFLLPAMLSLLLCEIYIEKKRPIIAVFFGICLWFMYEVRLNGISIVLCCAIAQLVELIRFRQDKNRSDFLKALLPYAVFFVLVFFSQAFFAKATPNTSDIGSGMSMEIFFENLKSYVRLIGHWLGLLWNSILINPLYSVSRRFVAVSFESFKPLRDLLVALSLASLVAGLVLEGKGKNLHLSIFTVVYIIIASALPYTQGLRYIYPLLPLILMFAAYLPTKAGRLFDKLPERMTELFSWLILAGFCIFIVYPHAVAALKGERGLRELTEISSPSDIYMQNAYSKDAIEVYHYIQAQTGEDDIIAFFAPRALYLNTQRTAIRPGVNGHEIEDADYYLQYLSVGSYPVDQPPDEGFALCFENAQFRMYEKLGK